MEYLEALKFLFNFPRSRIGPGTDSTSKLLNYLGNPHIGNKYIQITGSNGKGSTSRMISSILMESNLKVGLYTSPHLERLEERFVVDSQVCQQGQLLRLLEQVQPVVEALDSESPQQQGPTFFDITTAMAILFFHQSQVDCAVLEVGLGGRLDSTNICQPA